MATVSTTSEEAVARLAKKAGMTVTDYERWSREQARIGMVALREEFAEEVPGKAYKDDRALVHVTVPVHPRTLALFRTHGDHARRMGHILDRIAASEDADG